MNEPLTLPEIQELIRFATERPDLPIAKLILKAANVSFELLHEFTQGYQVRGELAEAQAVAMKNLEAENTRLRSDLGNEIENGGGTYCSWHGLPHDSITKETCPVLLLDEIFKLKSALADKDEAALDEIGNLSVELDDLRKKTREYESEIDSLRTEINGMREKHEKRLATVSGMMFGSGFEMGRSGKFSSALEAADALKKS